jgi:hypothetical protein
MTACFNINKKYHSLIVFNTCGTLIYHGGCFENVFQLKCSINGGLHPNILIVSWNLSKYLKMNS